jgi:K+-transporting ATPase KdpF subunit
VITDRRRRWDEPMSFLSLGLLVAVAALVIYLLATLIFPERF